MITKNRGEAVTLVSALVTKDTPEKRLIFQKNHAKIPKKGKLAQFLRLHNRLHRLHSHSRPRFALCLRRAAPLAKRRQLDTAPRPAPPLLGPQAPHAAPFTPTCSSCLPLPHSRRPSDSCPPAARRLRPPEGVARGGSRAAALTHPAAASAEKCSPRRRRAPAPDPRRSSA